MEPILKERRGLRYSLSSKFALVFIAVLFVLVSLVTVFVVLKLVAHPDEGRERLTGAALSPKAISQPEASRNRGLKDQGSISDEGRGVSASG